MSQPTPLLDVSRLLQLDALTLLRGQFLGSGAAREVFSFRVDPAYVVKFETTKTFQNMLEWETWTWVRGTKAEKWFAPCAWISDMGSVLIQKRVRPMGEKEYPIRMPEWLADFKPNNYGWYNGRIVCCDYGTNQLIRAGLAGPTKMQKIEWRLGES